MHARTCAGHANTSTKKSGNFVCEVRKMNCFSPGCARTHVQASSRRTAAALSDSHRNTEGKPIKRLRIAAFYGAPQKAAKRNFVGKRRNDEAV